MTVRIDQYSDLQAQAKAIGEKGPQFKPGEKVLVLTLAATPRRPLSNGSAARRSTASSRSGSCSCALGDCLNLSKADDLARKSCCKASLYFGSPGKRTDLKPEHSVSVRVGLAARSYSTPADYARFIVLLMDSGMAGGKRLLSNEAIARILTPRPPMKEQYCN